MGEKSVERWHRYRTVEAWARELRVAPEALEERLQGTASRVGSTPDGAAVACYAEADVRAACADLLS